jgi:dGTPase
MNWNSLLNSNRLRKSDRETKNDPRNEFESDFGRVIFSPAIRRMHDKTQVQPLTSDDNIHSRLTHSLEVMTIGYSLGIRLLDDKNFIEKSSLDADQLLRQIPIILKNVCLVHDIGNPPFGHFGEQVIQNYFKSYFDRCSLELNKQEQEDFTMFDGNAQGFRVLTKLQVLDDQYGLNLTYATLASFLKYPNTENIDKNYLCTKKRGVYQSEKEYLNIISKNCELLNEENKPLRHPLSFLMEAADSICYLVMDLEDGFNKEWYDFEFIKHFLLDIKALDSIIKFADSKISDVNKMVTLRRELISYLVDLASSNFITKYDLIINGKYNKELIDDDESMVAQTLQEFTNNYIFTKKEIRFLELTGDSVISGLLDYYTKFLFHDNVHYRNRAIGLISRSIIKAANLENGLAADSHFDNLPTYYKLRVIVDFISGMTDQYALNHYQKLSGQKIV